MKLARYDMFVDAIRADPSIARAMDDARSELHVYRRDEGNWYAEDGTTAADEELERRLDAALARPAEQYATFGETAYFPVPVLEAVVEARCASLPGPDTLDGIAVRISVDLSLSLDRFQATHHDLTGLVNRAEFNRLLFLRLEALSIARTPLGPDADDDGPNEFEAPQAVGIVAIDIDHFKQVNDTFGHLYGDVVLRAIAYRLETMLRRRGPSFGFEAIPAHPSGEEFLILLAGRFTTEQERDFAELVRAEIGSNRVPTDAEWMELTRGEPPDGIVLPDPVHRRVTISLGISSVRGLIDGDAVRQLGFTLKNRADIALGKAKMSGRDRTVAFADILMGLGRVLEHHKETDIIAIDLGRHVDVAVGQEFIVYHPTFAGNQPFLFDDGRTKRKLGEYPRIPSGRIEVFQVQADVSFCRVTSNRAGIPFTQGSLLEAVPLGGITQLIPQEVSGRIALLGQADLEDRVRELARAGSGAYAAVFALLNADELIETFGTAYVNRVLVELYSLIRKRLPRTPAVGQIAPTQLACVGFDDNDLEDKDASAILQSVQAAHHGARLGAGLYCEQDRLRFADKQDLPQFDGRMLDPEGALDFARYAMVAGRFQNVPVVHFDHLTPDIVLSAIRSSQTVEQIEQEYERMHRLGAVNSKALNQLALMYVSRRDYAKADRIYASILDLDLPDRTARATFLNNSATNKWLLGDHGASVQQFREAMQENGRSAPETRFRGYYALALYGLHRDGGDVPDELPASELRQALELGRRALPRWQAERIQKALADLQARRPDPEAAEPGPEIPQAEVHDDGKPAHPLSDGFGPAAAAPDGGQAHPGPPGGERGALAVRQPDAPHDHHAPARA